MSSETRRRASFVCGRGDGGVLSESALLEQPPRVSAWEEEEQLPRCKPGAVAIHRDIGPVGGAGGESAKGLLCQSSCQTAVPGALRCRERGPGGVAG